MEHVDDLLSTTSVNDDYLLHALSDRGDQARAGQFKATDSILPQQRARAYLVAYLVPDGDAQEEIKSKACDALPLAEKLKCGKQP